MAPAPRSRQSCALVTAAWFLTGSRSSERQYREMVCVLDEVGNEDAAETHTSDSALVDGDPVPGAECRARAPCGRSRTTDGGAGKDVAHCGQQSSNAVCTLRAQDDSGAVRTLKLYADDDGEVRFHVRPSAETDNAPNLQLSCEAN